MNREDLSEEEADLLGIAQPTQEEIDAEDARKVRVKLRIDLLVNLMRNDLFREWLMEKLVSFNTFGATFSATPTGFPDPYATWFSAGMKAAGWSIWEEIDDMAPDLASLMRRERTAG